MIRNYFKIAWRNLLKNKVYSFINIAGLATGMAVAIMIGLWVWDELSFNKSHKNYNDISLVWLFAVEPSTGEKLGSESMPVPMGPTLRKDYGQYFKHVLMSNWEGDYTIKSNNNNFQKKGLFIEPGVIDMLSLKMVKGSKESLNDLHSIILSESGAKAIFGDADPVNQLMKIDNRIDVKVTGVYQDLENNSTWGSLEFFAPWDLFVASNDWVKMNKDIWDNSSHNTFVQLAPNVTLEQANAAINQLYVKNTPRDFSALVLKYKPEIWLFPMSDWHLYSEFKDGKPTGGRITFVWLFGIVGVFVLLLACINFMNLSTARSEKRAKEVGVRKAIGSMKSQLVYQFMSESFLVVFLSLVFSMFLVFSLLGLFNELAAKQIEVPLDNVYFWGAIGVFVVLTSFLAGLYPAFYLSSFQPVKVLKGTIRLGRFASLPRKALVVVQFTVSVVLIIGTMVVYKQIQHTRNRPVGYERNGLITVSMNDPNYRGKHELIKRELINTGVVENVAQSTSPFTAVWSNTGGYTWKGKDPESEASFAVDDVTYEYGKTSGWKLIAGRDFSKDFASDSSGVIINETAAKYMALKNPVGEYIKLGNGSWQIIGVVKDLLKDSPYEPVKKTLFFLDKNYTSSSQLHIRMSPQVTASEAMPKIEAVLKQLVPTASFNYKFVDQEYGYKFAQEERVGKLASVFAVLAVLISCLGLFGLVSFVAEQRTKEIGIRKILGATVANLWQMLSRDFVVLVLISCFIAGPIAWYFMNQWLQKYNYHTEISWWIFAVSGVGALVITLLTVSFQAIKAALMDPVKSLRSE